LHDGNQTLWSIKQTFLTAQLATAFLNKRGKPSQPTSEKTTYISKLEDLMAARKDLAQRIAEAQVRLVPSASRR